MNNEKQESIDRHRATSETVNQQIALDIEDRKNTAGQESVPNTNDSKRVVSLNEVNNGEDAKPEKKQHAIKWLPDLIKSLEALAWIGTAFTCVIALFTLLEMKAERNNAYRPDIVVSPGIFEGGLVNTDEFREAGKYMYINPESSDPISSYGKSPTKNENCLYLEKPYLTLTNIGNGTAKDIQVTFHTDWLEGMVDQLNRIGDGYKYEMEIEYRKYGGVNSVILYYSNDDSSADEPMFLYLSYEKELSANITYIKSDDSTVRVALPRGYNELLAIIYGRQVRKNALNNKNGTTGIQLLIPDLVITVQYLDLQGVRYTQEISIPWTGYYQKSRFKSSSSDERDEETEVYLWTGFYEDYIR